LFANHVDVGNALGNNVQSKTCVDEGGGAESDFLHVGFPLPSFDANLVQKNGCNVVFFAVGLGLNALVVFHADGLRPQHTTLVGDKPGFRV